MRVAIAAVLVVGCGADHVDLTGVYHVDSAIGSMPCGTDTTLANYPAFLRFQKMDLFGNPYFAWDGCTDAAATDCTTLGGTLVGGFFEPQSNGWLGRESYASGGGDSPCDLGIVHQTATLRMKALEIEVNGYEDEVLGLTTDQCSPDAAEQRGEAMPCVNHQLIEASEL